jgi:hypothetical protein
MTETETAIDMAPGVPQVVAGAAPAVFAAIHKGARSSGEHQSVAATLLRALKDLSRGVAPFLVRRHAGCGMVLV